MIATRRTSDDVLARRAGAGDDEAFATLFERHAGALYRYCRSIVGHDQDAQDAVQNTMVGALAALHRAPLDAPLRPWLFRIGHNESISLLRHRKPADDLDAQFALAGAPIEGQLEDRERMSSLVADLRELPERQRSALVMRELSGLSHEEISVALAIPVSATKQAIFDARRGLQAAEEGRRMTCDPVQRAISDGDGRVLRARQMRAHLRGCPSCSGMRDAIATREKDLAALIPPLPAFAATALLERIVEAAALGGGAVATGIGAGGGGAGAGALAGTAATAAGKAGGIAGLALSGKALAVTAAILTAGTAATVVVERQVAPSASSSAQASAPATAGTLATVGLGTGGVFSPVGSGGTSPSTSGLSPSGGSGGASGAGGGSTTSGGSSAPAASAPGTPGAETSPGSGILPAGVQVPGTTTGGGADPAHPGGTGGSSSGGSGGAGGTGSSTPEKVAGAVTQAPSTVVDAGKETVGNVTQAAGETVTNVVDDTTQAAGNATQSAGDAAGQAVGVVKQTTDKVVDTVKQTTDKVVDTATDVLSRLPGGKPKH